MIHGSPKVIGAEDLAVYPRRAPENERIVPRGRPTAAELDERRCRACVALAGLAGAPLLYLLMFLACC